MQGVYKSTTLNSSKAGRGEKDANASGGEPTSARQMPSLNSKFFKTDKDGIRMSFAKAMQNMRHADDIGKYAKAGLCDDLSCSASGSEKSWTCHGTKPLCSLIDDAVREDSDLDNLPGELSPSYKRTPRRDSLHSKSSAQTYRSDSLYRPNTAVAAASYLDDKFLTAAEESEALFNLSSKVHQTTMARAMAPEKSDINLILVMGMFLGIGLSLGLQYLLKYLNWMQAKVLQVRNSIMGCESFWEFCSSGAISPNENRSKMLLMLLVVPMSVLFCLIALLRITLELLLTEAPMTVIQFFKKSVFEG